MPEIVSHPLKDEDTRERHARERKREQNHDGVETPTVCASLKTALRRDASS